MNLVEMKNRFCFAFECMFILSPSLIQGEKADLFEVVVVMIKHVNIKRKVFSIQVCAYTVSFKKKIVHFSLPPPCAYVSTSIFKPCNILPLIARQEVFRNERILFSSCSTVTCDRG